MGEAAGDLERAGVEFGPLAYRGSNEMLIAPKRTAMNAPIAIIDPHVHWYDAMRFYEVQDLHARVQRRGRVDPGRAAAHPGPQPLLLGRHDHRRARTRRTSSRKRSTRRTPISIATTASGAISPSARTTIGVKNGDKVEPREVAIAFSHHGPIVARKDGKAYAMAIPYCQRSRPDRPVLRDDDGAQPRRDEAGPVAPAIDGAEHHGRARCRATSTTCETAACRSAPPGVDPGQADPGQHLGHRVARASTRCPTWCRSRTRPAAGCRTATARRRR